MEHDSPVCPCEMKSNCVLVEAAAAAQPSGQGKLFFVCCGLCGGPSLCKQEVGFAEHREEVDLASYCLGMVYGEDGTCAKSPSQGARVDRHNLQGEIQDIRKKLYNRGLDIELGGESTVKKKFRKPRDAAVLSRWWGKQE